MEMRATAVFLCIVSGFIVTICSSSENGDHVDNRVPMGVLNPSCDDGKTNLTRDYDGNTMSYTCFEDPQLFAPNPRIRPVVEHEKIPKFYMAPHCCMNESITYESNIPTFGAHRPIWPQYGEYVFVPKQRWLHNLEHGAVVMLYHPCADRNEVKFLKKVLTNCLFRHVITPSTDLTYDRPLALLTWGYRLLFSKVDMEVVVKFIKHHANRGPEKTAKDGQYNSLLIEHANLVSGTDDTEICPFYNM